MSFSWTTLALLALVAALGALVGRAFPQEDDRPKLGEAELQAFEMADLLKRRAEKGGPWLPFLKVPTLSCGVYVLEKGGRDGQSAHGEDEVYHVLEGRATLAVGEGDAVEQVPVKPGSVVFVKRGIDHRFHTIEEDLKVLVFFASHAPE